MSFLTELVVTSVAVVLMGLVVAFVDLCGPEYDDLQKEGVSFEAGSSSRQQQQASGNGSSSNRQQAALHHCKEQQQQAAAS